MSPAMTFFSSSSLSIRSTRLLSCPWAKLVFVSMAGPVLLVLVSWFESRFLRRACFALIFRLPLGIGHAIDMGARVLAGDSEALGPGGLLIPVGQAIAAEAGQIHQVDVLDIGASAQMLHKTAEHRGFKLGLGLLVDHHEPPFINASRFGASREIHSSTPDWCAARS